MAATGQDEERQHEAPAPPGTQRLDKWLWFARVTKSRTLAAHLVQEGRIRLNRARAAKPSQSVRAGDVLTIAVRGRVDILKILAPGTHRGPPTEARTLYEVLTPGGDDRRSEGGPQGVRQQGTGRPTKRDRRRLDRLTEPD
ncbi:MAG: RNA-binding S4 domain-containing protein [Hyphomicrobiaceae bacterium]|nr:MAG: RNA-binding S4 domain-containing protein [Hyphomicrobiaceae bacterium]